MSASVSAMDRLAGSSFTSHNNASSCKSLDGNGSLKKLPRTSIISSNRSLVGGGEVGAVGDVVGFKVGAGLGAGVGDAVGDFVGALLGADVGLFVGESVGLELDISVGDPEGGTVEET